MGGYVRVRGKNECGEGSPSAMLEVSIKGKPASAGGISGPSDVCVGTRVMFETIEISGAETYEWEFSEGMISSSLQSHTTILNNINVDVLKEGYVTVYGKNECGEGQPSASFFVSTTSLNDFEAPEILKDCNMLYHDHPEERLQWYKDGHLINTDTNQLVIQELGLYSLQYSTRCGELEDKINIEEKDLQWFIPNVFTPNGDGKNDTFQLSENLCGSKLEIYNRWGRKVYEADAYKNEWDGRELSSGVYSYIVYPICFENPITGKLSILRQ